MKTKTTIIAASILALSGIAHATTPAATAPAAAQPPAGTSIPVLRNAEVPAPMERAGSAPVSPRDRAAAEAVRRWEQNGTADALVGPGGDIRFAYGYSRPTVTCSPLHVCTIRLIPGESITSSRSATRSAGWLSKPWLATPPSYSSNLPRGVSVRIS